MDTPLLNLDKVTFQTGKTAILNQVSFQAKQGEIHSIAGQKDAGKTTLARILTGIIPTGTYSGSFSFQGKPCQFQNITESEAHGIAAVHQDTSLVKRMSVCENIFLAHEFATQGIIDWDKAFLETRKVLERIALNIHPGTLISELSPWEVQMVKVAKALARNPVLIIFDEITSPLSEDEGESFLQIMRELKNQGFSILFISSRMNEIFTIADRITILCQGKVLSTEETQNLDQESTILQISGREIQHSGSIQEKYACFGISEREQEIITLLLKGLNNQQICEKLFISLNTVKTHVYSIYKKTNVRNRMELARILKDHPESPRN